MKKILLLVIMIFPIFVFGMEYSDSSVNLTVNVDNYMVFTRDNLKDNLGLDELGLTEEEMLDIMNKNELYFDIIPNDLSHEILVIVPNEKTLLNNLSNAPEKFLNEVGDELASSVGLDKSIVYKNKYVYLVRDYYDKNSGYNIINYYTVVNAQGYNFQLQKKGDILDEERNTLKRIVDSAEIKILDKYKDESVEVKEAISNKSGINWKNVLIKAAVGGICGAIGGVIISLINKKRKQV